MFTCDFGKIGIQICMDLFFDEGWETLARKGAEIVAFPSQTPQTIRPRRLALQNGYFIVSSTWKNNASVFDPTGDLIAPLPGVWPLPLPPPPPPVLQQSILFPRVRYFPSG